MPLEFAGISKGAERCGLSLVNFSRDKQTRYIYNNLSNCVQLNSTIQQGDPLHGFLRRIFIVTILFVVEERFATSLHRKEHR